MQKDVLFSRAHCSFIPWMVSFALTLSALQTWFSGTCSFLFIVSKYSHPVFCSKIRYLDLLFPDEHLYTSLATSGCLGRLSPHVTCGPVWALWQDHRIKQYCPHHTPSVGISVQRLSPRPRCLKLTWPPTCRRQFFLLGLWCQLETWACSSQVLFFLASWSVWSLFHLLSHGSCSGSFSSVLLDCSEQTATFPSFQLLSHHLHLHEVLLSSTCVHLKTFVFFCCCCLLEISRGSSDVYLVLPVIITMSNLKNTIWYKTNNINIQILVVSVFFIKAWVASFPQIFL